MLEGRMAIQTDPGRLEEWASRNHMKIKIKKCQVWELGRKSPWVDTGWDMIGCGGATLEKLCWEGGVDGKVGVPQQCVLAAKKGKSILSCTKSSTARRSIGVISTSPQHFWDGSQGSSFGSLAQYETLANWSEFHLGALVLCRKAEEAGNFGGPNSSPQVLMRRSWKHESQTAHKHGERVRDNGQNLEQDRIHLDISRNLLTPRVVEQWGRLYREVMQSLSLRVFKTRLGLRHKDLNNLSDLIAE